MIESMLVATDGSETAAEAVSQAADLAAGTGAKVHVMTAYQPLHARVATGKTVDPERGQWQLAQDSWADTVLDDACAVLRLRGVEAQPHARKGDPADAIIEPGRGAGHRPHRRGQQGAHGSAPLPAGQRPRQGLPSRPLQRADRAHDLRPPPGSGRSGPGALPRAAGALIRLGLARARGLAGSGLAVAAAGVALELFGDRLRRSTASRIAFGACFPSETWLGSSESWRATFLRRPWRASARRASRRSSHSP